MALTAEQRRILNRIVDRGLKRGATPMEIKSAVETGWVETRLRNLPGGTGRSRGWRQEDANLYADPTNLDASIDRYYAEARAQRGRQSSAGNLAAAVQRPAAAYRGRYQQASGVADNLLDLVRPGMRGASGAAAASVPSEGGAPGRRALLQQYLATRGQPGALAQLGAGLAQAPTGNPATAPAAAAPGGGGPSTYAKRADAIDRQRLPYQWGGGHAGKVNPYKAVPLDCSGAISSVLGIDPRVSGQFTTWGKPGDGGANSITVYANDRHVLAKIGNRWFGTSASNPGGGAGWIPAAQVSKRYLAGFTVRHAPLR